MEKKANKTKKRLVIVAAMLILVLAIGATAGTTLARYISSATVETQTATVAQWGFTLTATTEKMFGTKYGNEHPLASVNNENGSLVVKADSNNAKNIVAPGTTGEMTMTLQGSSEVMAELVLDVDAAFSTVYLNSYYPIQWQVTVDETTTDWTRVENAAGIAGLLSSAINDNTDLADQYVTSGIKDGKVYVHIPDNTELSVDTIKIAWKWDFQDADHAEYDNFDTLLGYLADRDYNEGSNLNGWATQYGAPDLTVKEYLDKNYGDHKDYNLVITLDITATIMQVQAWTVVD